MCCFVIWLYHIQVIKLSNLHLTVVKFNLIDFCFLCLTDILWKCGSRPTGGSTLLPCMLYQLCFSLVSLNGCLQCLDTVGWASGRVPDLYKLSDGVLVWLSVWSEVQIVGMWSSWCQCHPKTPSFKFRLVSPFWYRLTQVVLDKRPLNGCNSSGSLVSLNASDLACCNFDVHYPDLVFFARTVGCVCVSLNTYCHFPVAVFS